MPHRPATWIDLLPASKLLAAAFNDDHLFGEYLHPRRNDFPEDVYLYYLRWLREAYFTAHEYLIVTYASDASGKESHITGLAHWIRNYSEPPRPSLSGVVMVKLISAYNVAEDYFYPNRAIDYDHDKQLIDSYRFFKHHWTGTRADSWHLSLLGVDPKEEKRGFGRELVAWGFDRSVEEGVSVSVVSAPRQEGFYRKCGFDAFVGTMGDEGGDANPHTALARSPILFCDHGVEPTGMKGFEE